MLSARSGTERSAHASRSRRLPAPLWARMAVLAGLGCCMVGGLLGLLLGLSHPATVWFAIPEGAFILGVAGALTGLVLGAVATAARALWRAARPG